MMVHHFKTIPRQKNKNPSKSDNVNSFQDPRPKPKKKVTFEDSTTVVLLFEYKESTNKMSESTSSTSHSSHQKQHFSPQSPSSSPSCTALIHRETSESWPQRTTQHKGIQPSSELRTSIPNSQQDLQP